ncbi:hypothetical protein [Streptomyces sp. NPDC046942]
MARPLPAADGGTTAAVPMAVAPYLCNGWGSPPDPFAGCTG